jgi:hypothetical protein
MRATITATGELRVHAENELESWALKCWYAGYNERLTDDRPVLTIQTTESSSPCSPGDKE